MAAARKTNDDAALSEAQAASRSPEAPETAAPAAPTPPVPPTPAASVLACPNCKRGVAERYEGANPFKIGTVWCGRCGRRSRLEE